MKMQKFDIYPKTQQRESGLGIGVRALLSFSLSDELDNLVPEMLPPVANRPLLVFVEASDDKLPFTGLILPRGTFEVGESSVKFFALAEQHGDDVVGLSTGASQSIAHKDVAWVSDSSGAYWNGPLYER